MNVAPLRTALLSAAEAEAESVIVDASSRAAREISDAQAEVTALVDRARAEGEAAARREAIHVVGRARSEGRALVLAAQREVYDELHRRTLADVEALRLEPAYGRLLERLEGMARAQLGPKASVEVDPPTIGGVRASSGKRRIDLTLPALADRCLAALGTELERLWQ
jgi:vacuolar-type H+-ATPase subunit E/Vma4